MNREYTTRSLRPSSLTGTTALICARNRNTCACMYVPTVLYAYGHRPAGRAAGQCGTYSIAGPAVRGGRAQTTRSISGRRPATARAPGMHACGWSYTFMSTTCTAGERNVRWCAAAACMYACRPDVHWWVRVLLIGRYGVSWSEAAGRLAATARGAGGGSERAGARPRPWPARAGFTFSRGACVPMPTAAGHRPLRCTARPHRPSNLRACTLGSGVTTAYSLHPPYSRWQRI
jgi:hypothetical protein